MANDNKNDKAKLNGYKWNHTIDTGHVKGANYNCLDSSASARARDINYISSRKEWAKAIGSNLYTRNVGENGLPWSSPVPKFREALYETWSMENTLHGIGQTYNRLMSRMLNLQGFNKNKVINVSDYINFGRSYVFITKPDLFIFENAALGVDGINRSIAANCPDLYSKIVKNIDVAKQLQSIYNIMPVTIGGKGFVKLLSNMCTDVSFPTMALTTRDANKNMKGYGIKYGGDFLEDLKATEIEMQFYDNRYNDVRTLIEIWTEYIEGVSQGKIFPKRMYRDMNILDYAVSIYIINVDEVNTITSIGGLVGCYPRSINTTMVAHKSESLDAKFFQGPFSYSWQVSHVCRPNAQSTIDAFNYASGWNSIFNADTKNVEGQGNRIEFRGIDANGGTYEVKDFSFLSSYEFEFQGDTINQSYGSSGTNNEQKGGKNRYVMHHGIAAWGQDIIHNSINNVNGKDGKRHVNITTQLNITEFHPEFVGIAPALNTEDKTVKNFLMFFSRKSWLKKVEHKTDYSSLMLKTRKYDHWEYQVVNSKDNKTGKKRKTIKKVKVKTDTVDVIERGMTYWNDVMRRKIHPKYAHIEDTIKGVQPFNPIMLPVYKYINTNNPVDPRDLGDINEIMAKLKASALAQRESEVVEDDEVKSESKSKGLLSGLNTNLGLGGGSSVLGVGNYHKGNYNLDSSKLNLVDTSKTTPTVAHEEKVYNAKHNSNKHKSHTNNNKKITNLPKNNQGNTTNTIKNGKVAVPKTVNGNIGSTSDKNIKSSKTVLTGLF